MSLRFAYYPGCSQVASSAEYDQSVRSVCRALDIELVDVVGNRVLVATRGACATCQASQQTLKNFVELKLRVLVLPELTVEEVAP